MLEFINLHGHSLHSADSASKIPDLVKYVASIGQSSLAITDHGNMSAVIKFQKECKSNKIKPILGCEFYICPPQQSSLNKSSANKKLNHLVVLAKNKIGYQNLLKLVYLSNSPDRLYYRPRIDEDLLFAHNEGLIVLNGHHTTSIWDQLIFNHDALEKCNSLDEAREYLFPNWEEKVKVIADRYRSVFGDDFYIECQLFDREDISQQLTGTVLFEFAKKYGFKSVGSSDHHYIRPENAKAHKTFVAIKQNGKVKNLPKIRYFTGNDYCVVTNEKAKLCYPDDLILATQEIANKVEEYEITGPQRIPSATESKELSLSIVKELVYDGLKRIGKDQDQEYIDRVKYELEMTEKGELSDYFLIVKDYLDWARSNGILTGCGRGCLANTNVILKNGKIKDISEIKIGDKVFSKSGRLNKVLNTMKYDINEECLFIKTSNSDNSGIKSTLDHKFWCLSKENKSNHELAEWKQAKDIKIGDFLYQPIIKQKNIKKYFSTIKFANKKDKVLVNDNKIYHKINKNLTRVHPEIIEVDEDFAYLLGVFTGDGWLTKNNNTVCFVFNSKNSKDSEKRVKSILNKFGFTYSEQKQVCGKNANKIICHSSIMVNIFKNIFPNYKFTADTKSVPDFIFSQNKLIKENYILGYLHADGSVKKNGYSIEFSSISKRLLLQIKSLLLSIGIVSGLYSADRSKSIGQFCGKKIEYNLYTSNFTKQRSFTKNKITNDGIFVPVKKISKINDIKFVYDIEVENESNYLTTSGIAHNSVGGSLAAYLLKITSIDSIKYDLMWDRFMGPDRIENKVLADIDSDFQTSRREEVVEYIRNKFGEDKVCEVITFGMLQGKSAIKAVLSAWEILDHTQQKDISDRIQSKDKISDKLADFKEETGSDSILLYTLTHEPAALEAWVKLVDGKLEGELAPFFEIAIELEGSIKTESRHASALIISDRPIYEVAPMVKDKSKPHLLCAFDMYSFENAGLVKFDILGLKALCGLHEVNKLLEDIEIIDGQIQDYNLVKALGVINE